MFNVYKGAGLNLSQNPVMIVCPEPEPEELTLSDFPVFSDNVISSVDEEPDEILPDPRLLVEEAMREAEEIRSNALRDIEAQKTALEEDMQRKLEVERKRAYDIGLLEGAEKKVEDIENAIAAFSESIDEIKLNFNDFMDEQRSDIITLVLEVTEKILAKRLDNDDYIMVPIIQKALQDVKIKSHCAISVSEEATSLLAFLKKELINTKDPDSAMFDIVAKDMPLDFCVLEVDEELLDVSISTQFENLGNFLKHHE